MLLTKITIRNFKLFEEAQIPLGNGFVFIGPNNGGKTSALQALALWQIGLQKWAEKHGAKKVPVKRPGVTVNRLDLISLPVAEMDLIWSNRKVRRGLNENIRIDLIVEGICLGKEWKCGLEFDYSSPEAFFCRPLRQDLGNNERMEIPSEALDVKIAFLPPMSGLATEEALIQEGRINVLIGQGQTAEVLRNLCYRIYSKEDKEGWKALVKNIKDLFGVILNEPKNLLHRGTIDMKYTDKDGKTALDLPSSGRGMQQVLLLLAHLYDNPKDTVFLLDEPDAHLEILRQRKIYDLINEVAEEQSSQIVSASHSEVLLNAAAEKKSAVVFVGKNPHRLGENKSSEVLQSLAEIGFEYYYYAEINGWILYVEGESDLNILQAFAKKLKHPAAKYLQEPLVKYIRSNAPDNARRHFHGIREGVNGLEGFLLLDRVDKPLRNEEGLFEMMWKKREIENYLCNRRAILSYVADGLNRSDLFGNAEAKERQNQIEAEIAKLEKALETLGGPMPFSDDIKASDDFLVRLFRNFADSFGRSITLEKKDFYKLVKYIPDDEIDEEVTKVLDKIAKIAGRKKRRCSADV